MTGPRVAILADDLIWATRLADVASAAGATPRPVRSLDGLRLALAEVSFAVVDLTARAYDGVEAVRLATSSGARVLAVGQHDDHELRKAARAAGAERVVAYRKLFEDGPAVVRAWLEG